MKMTFEQWEEKYQPVYRFDNDWYLLTGDYEKWEENKTWTIVEADGEYLIVSGLWSVNSLANIITRVPFEVQEDDEIYIDITREQYYTLIR